MLSLLHIENIAVIEAADIEFHPGFNVLTGETGTGKSIIIDSINAISGERTSRELIRTGADRAFISALFIHLHQDIVRKLSEWGLSSDDDTCLISREIHAEGKNICRVNGRPVNVSLLKSVGPLLISIHGQHDGQRLLLEESHIDFLDAYAQNFQLLNDYAAKFKELSEIVARIRELSMDEDKKQRQTDTLTYQIAELTAAALKAGEEEELHGRRNLLVNAGKITAFLDAAYEKFYGQDLSDGGVLSAMSDIARSLQSAFAVSPDFSAISSRAEELKYLVEEAAAELRDIRYGLDFSADELEKIEERLDLIYRLKKKYGATIGAMLEYLSSAQAELSQIESADELIAELKSQYRNLRKEAFGIAAELSETRRKKAVVLQDQIMSELSHLEMTGARFIVSVDARCDDKGRPKLFANGCDSVSFLISANKGEEPRALSRVASGGELSRVMLALKNVLSLADPVETLIFDEIDAGISGRAAQMVAEKLYAVSRKRQVLCVTHLPQIAAMADTHFLIEKNERDGRTYTHVECVGGVERVYEIARVITGRTVTEAAAQNAEELISAAEKYKKTYL